MPRPTRRHTISVSVLAAALSISLVACGQDDADLATDTEEQIVQTTDSVEAPDRQEDVSPSEADRAAIDDAEQLFASTVGGSYVLTFDLISQVSAEAGPVRVEVVDGRAANVTYPDEISEQILPQIPMLTVVDFFERARSVLGDGGGVEVDFDEFYGYPLTMTLDPIPEAIDDEMSIVVRSVEPVEESLETDGY